MVLAAGAGGGIGTQGVPDEGEEPPRREQAHGDVQWGELERWAADIELNLSSHFLCCRLVVPIMQEAGGGTFVNVSSVNAIWNIGEFGMQADPTRTQGRRTKKAQPSNEKPLGQWNKYVITVDGDTVTLKVNGQVQNVATKCDEVAGTIGLQSEGAEIHFRNIRLTPLE